MGELTFKVYLIDSAKGGVKPVLWGESSLSEFGERVRDVGVDYVSEQIDITDWEEFFEHKVSSSQVVRLGQITIDDKKDIIDDGFFTKPTDGVSVMEHPLF